MRLQLYEQEVNGLYFAHNSRPLHLPTAALVAQTDNDTLRCDDLQPGWFKPAKVVRVGGCQGRVGSERNRSDHTIDECPATAAGNIE
jgi:hypothetical protein